MQFKHYKGGIYEWVGEATMEVDLTPMVVYRAADGTLWVRPKAVFFEEIEVAGIRQRRFALIESSKEAPGA